VYKQYADKDKAEEDYVSFKPPTRRKVPSSSRDSLYKRSIEVDLHLLTNAKSKQQKRTN
jgi:hypothetical protein